MQFYYSARKKERERAYGERPVERASKSLAGGLTWRMGLEYSVADGVE